MHINEQLHGWAHELDAAFDAVWATGWERNGRAAVAEPLGLPERPVLTLPFAHNATGLTIVGRGRARVKTAAIHPHLLEQPRAFAWADDELYRRTPPAPVRDLELEHLLVRPRHTVGLTQKDITRLLEFAHKQN